MRLPTLHAIIDRRILVNYRIDPDALRAILPPAFEPLTVGGLAIGGVCLIRLKHVRPAGLPASLGFTSENAAYRFAVEYDSPTGRRPAVYIPHRHTSSCINALVGGRVFPGRHTRARFEVAETDERFRIDMRTPAGDADLTIDATRTDTLEGSLFGSADAASEFFRTGSLGFSATSDPAMFDALELDCRDWAVEPLRVDRVRSAFFDDPARFPGASAAFDSALLMRNIRHRWVAHDPLCCAA